MKVHGLFHAKMPIQIYTTAIGISYGDDDVVMDFDFIVFYAVIN